VAKISLDVGSLGNRLLDAMPSDVLHNIRPHLELVALAANQTVHEPGEATEYVFFPTRGLISLVAVLDDGESVEVGMVGKEGLYGVSVFLGDDRPVQRAMVQLAGSALRISSRLFQHEVQSNAALQSLLLRYVQVTLTTAIQAAACNRLHKLEQRFARWLLAAHDRAEAATFPMTHEFLAMMLGVRRPGVTIAAQSLQADGVITYNHGTMTIVDRNGLEAASCECYRFVQGEFARLLGPTRA